MLLLLQGSVDQSALAPAGPVASRVAELWWLAFWIAAGVYVLTIGALGWATWRARRRDARGEALPANTERRLTRVVSGAVAATVALLLVFLSADLLVGRTLSPAPTRRPLTIELTGHQWWWEVQYADTGVSGRFTTANEIHVPVRQPVVLVLSARDVIHSVWVPSLAGKKDLVPGRPQTLWFQADTAGVYRGQCAEFCGTQHAKMALVVVAEPAERYAAWARRQLQQAAAPNDSVVARGEQVFLRGSCPMCHAITGTNAFARAGPDLTHVGSRLTLAAGALPNTRDALARWIADPQAVKPGSNMPPNALPRADLDALVSYLRSLR